MFSIMHTLTDLKLFNAHSHTHSFSVLILLLPFSVYFHVKDIFIHLCW